MSPVFALGFGLYLLNLGVGLAAQLRLARFGVWHHWLYFAVFLSAAAALFFTRQAGLILTVASLAAFPWARPRSWIHPTLGALGLVGYLLSLNP
ncbi:MULTISPECIES: hypothetical protein [unclassified Meiothermus]|uniref:hypothetical protein n=1 Tax=unclassified Meiothermus TaxID=370471 RepID=UPI000D7D1381|nr:MULTISPECIES: hypothetical protein [unclassified Meiothermus]PZA07815.1 hypothetical protein DNA98_05780 [Meiothermus sp. Pnk-1]RYM38882.1 hypothetical protein EWH23_03905 [Meiothermus sp. PNK-Is4]